MLLNPGPPAVTAAPGIPWESTPKPHRPVELQLLSLLGPRARRALAPHPRGPGSGEAVRWMANCLETRKGPGHGRGSWQCLIKLLCKPSAPGRRLRNALIEHPASPCEQRPPATRTAHQTRRTTINHADAGRGPGQGQRVLREGLTDKVRWSRDLRARGRSHCGHPQQSPGTSRSRLNPLHHSSNFMPQPDACKKFSVSFSQLFFRRKVLEAAAQPRKP